MWYEVLKVAFNASEKEIKHAFKKLSRIYHPDKNMDRQEWASEKFKQISEARDIGLDPMRRHTQKRKSSTVPPPSSRHTYKPKAADILVKAQVTVAQILNSDNLDVEYTYQNAHYKNKRRRMTINLDPTTREGKTVYPGLGHCPPSAQPGDVIVELEVDYGKYLVKGDDLVITRDITLLEAFSDSKIPVVLPSGEEREVLCPWTPGESLASFHLNIVFQGLGRKDGSRGHFKIKFRIMAPEIKPERRDMFMYGMGGEPEGPPRKRSKLLS